MTFSDYVFIAFFFVLIGMAFIPWLLQKVSMRRDRRMDELDGSDKIRNDLDLHDDGA